MNKKEFEEMQAEFAETIYNFENFLKEGIILDYKYNYAFYPLLKKTHYYETENVMLTRGLKLADEGFMVDVDAMLATTRDAYLKDLPHQDAKHNYSKIVIGAYRQATKEEKMEFEQVFKEFIAKNHPVVKAITTKEEQKAYSELMFFYYENNYEGYKKHYETVKHLFKEVTYTEEMYTKISEYYYGVRKQIGQAHQQKVSQYPYTKRVVFTDEMEIAREEGELKHHLGELKKDNKQLHEEFAKVYERDEVLMEDPGF